MAAAATPMAGLATSINPGSDLASLFECPVCFDYVLPPILQVNNLSKYHVLKLSALFDSNVSFNTAFLYPPLPSATRAIWSAPTADRSSPAAPPAEASLEGTLGTSPWRRCSSKTSVFLVLSLKMLPSGGLHSNVPLQVLQWRLHGVPPSH